MERCNVQGERQVDLEAQLLGDRLAGEQISLARLVLGEAYLVRPLRSDRATEKATARSLQGDEVSQFLDFWKSAPLGCIRSMNHGIGRLKDPSWIRPYVEAAVDLEILMDRTLGSGAQTGDATPAYLSDGYTVMDRSVAGHRSAKRIGVDKEQLRSRLVECKELALAVLATEKLLAAYYDAVIQDLERDPESVEPAFAVDDERIAVSLYLKEGFKLSRLLAIRYQLCLQEAGVDSLLVEGNLKLFGTKLRHAWNLAWFDRQVALVDVTLPGIECPLILLGASPEEVYREATRCDRLYTPSAESLYSWTVAVSAGCAESPVVPGSERHRAAASEGSSREPDALEPKKTQ